MLICWDLQKCLNAGIYMDFLCVRIFVTEKTIFLRLAPSAVLSEKKLRSKTK